MAKATKKRSSPAQPPPPQGPVCDRMILLNENGVARVGLGGTIGLNRLTICDDHGTMFMDFKLTNAGQPVFAMFDKGVLRAALAVRGEEVGLFLCDGKETPRIALTVTADGEPRLSFRDANGHRRALLGLFSDDSGVLTLNDKKESPRLALMNVGDDPTVFLSDKQGRTVWEASESSVTQHSASKAKKAAARVSRRLALTAR